MRIVPVLLACLCAVQIDLAAANANDLRQTILSTQSKVAKIYGAGGLRQLEAYQSGIVISPEGHVLTVMSYVLDTDDIAVILDDGRKRQAEFIGSDPVTELALLKIPVIDSPLPYFDLQKAATLRQANPGQRILALSNLYGIATGEESVSVLQGVITAVAPLQARRGAFQANYRDQVYVVDASANNPGAAGGALVDWQGQLLGILGKELRSEVTGTWLNYALPTTSFASTVDALLQGLEINSNADFIKPEQSHTAESLGLALIPDVLPRTPPYVDSVRMNSPAQTAGLRPDDLIVFVAEQPVDSYRSFVEQLARHDANQMLSISVLREGALQEFTLRSEPPAADENVTPAIDELP